MKENAGCILDRVNFPEDLRKLDISELPQLCEELREFIIDEVSCNPGHFGASLGAIELTVALHYVYDTPFDQLIWDVGHQAYGHKILTGRKDRFKTNRKYKGISGFPSPKESEYDAFGVGHSSTSISAALGMAVAAQNKGEDRKVIAIIGDGSMTGGMAFEALNNLAEKKSDVLVVLNDNKIAIDSYTGALREYLTDIATSRTYNRVKYDVWRILGKVNKLGPNAQGIVQRVNNAVKTFVSKSSNIFESLNIRYFGPVDGHDVIYLVRVFQDMKTIKGPKLLHCITTKGKGFLEAEKNQTVWHAPGVFDKTTGAIKYENDKNIPPKFQDVFGDTIIELAEKNKNIVAVTPAMLSGCSLNKMMSEMPHRTFDVGIAEQHAVTFSAGLAKAGLLPFCNLYSTFAQRAYDQIIHDVGIQNLHVIFCFDRGGIVGNDGATHHGAFDLAFMRCIPNFVIAAPMDEIELRNLMFTAQLEKNKFPFVIRYPRGRGIHKDWKKPLEELKIGEGRKIKDGKDIAILSLGTAGIKAKQACENLSKDGISVAQYDFRFLKPLDEKLLDEIFKKFDKIVTVEDGTIVGGFGTSVLEAAADRKYKGDIKRLGIPDKFVEHGSQLELIKECGYDINSIIEVVVNFIKK
ncbi:MAG TPA: 1-deoxy-D-xylulose-5-phosphate synthase [Bacteroidales bacterium]|nr:1-deoxy-D-xylulose-5-phosphate synthase [Bacteroidales bacterium]